MRRLLITLAALSAVPWSASPALPCRKPVAPIDLHVTVEGDPATGVRIDAAASARGREVELEIVLPAEVSALAGDRKGAGRRVELHLETRAPDRKRREILVRATIREGDAVLTRVEPVVLHDGPVPSPGTPGTGPRGEAILEFAP
jgi:hypothetical protein